MDTLPQPIEVAIDAISFAEYNPRSISKEDYSNLMSSIDTFGFTENIVLNDRKHSDFAEPRLTLVSGHMRTRAARDLGYTKLPAVILSLNKGQEEALNLAMNRISGEWDDQLLAELLYSMDEETRALSGFNDEEISKLLDSVSGDGEEEDEAPAVDEVNPPTSVLGEVYQLGVHRLMCGDSTKLEDVERLMAGAKADMVFTDPPYGISFSSNQRTVTAKFDVIENDDKILTEWIVPVLAASQGFMFIWTTWKVLSEWLEVTKPIGKMTNMIIWDKGGGGIGDLQGTFSTDYEIALVFNRGSQLAGDRLGSVWGINKDGSSTYVHPTQKPTALAEMAIKSTTIRGNKVLDVFGGSGSTLIACQQTERICYMMELDPKYCDVIRKRYHKLVTGGEEGWQVGTPVVASESQV